MLNEQLKYHVTYMIKYPDGNIILEKEVLSFRDRKGLTAENQLLVELSIAYKVHIDQVMLQSYFRLDD